MASISASLLSRSARFGSSARTATRYVTLQPRDLRRGLQTTARCAYPRKDTQDRESINTDATEYSKSGSDDNAAQQDRAAFEPGRTDPEEAMHEAGKGVSTIPI